MFKTLANAWNIADLRKKLLFTILIILLYRLGAAIPVPFTMPLELGNGGTTFNLLNTLSGGAFEQATLFALGVSPYITASIVIQLLTVAIPALEKLAKQGEEGKKKITEITRYITIAIAIVSAIGYYFMLKYGSGTGASSIGAFVYIDGKSGLNTFFDILQAIVIVACFCAGSAVVMWLAERINEHGIGNGISIILFANIVSRAYPLFINFINMFKTEVAGGSAASGLGQELTDTGTLRPLPDASLAGNAFPWGSLIFTVVALVGLLAMMWFIIFISDSERRIPVQYAKRVVGRKMYGGQNSNIPLKLNMAGVMPIIFANAIITIPSMIAQFLPYTRDDGTIRVVWYRIINLFSSTSWFFAILMFVFILAFAYFYVAISFNPTEVAGNLQKQGGAIPGIRPGKATSTFIQKVLSKITLIGALALSVISVIPLIINVIIDAVRRIETLPDSVLVPLWSFTYVAELATVGSSIIIVVGVVLEVVREMEAQMTMRHYKGFLD